MTTADTHAFVPSRVVLAFLQRHGEEPLHWLRPILLYDKISETYRQAQRTGAIDTLARHVKEELQACSTEEAIRSLYNWAKGQKDMSEPIPELPGVYEAKPSVLRKLHLRLQDDIATLNELVAYYKERSSDPGYLKED